jgi:hypothetical protein
VRRDVQQRVKLAFEGVRRRADLEGHRQVLGELVVQDGGVE